MNRLLVKAPFMVMIDGKEYVINTSWRDCLFTITQMQNHEFEPEERAHILLNNMYLEDPPNVNEAIRQAMWFLRCGEEQKDDKHPKYFDFEQDAGLIYGAFLKADIDLDEVDMHWWKWVARLPELPESMWSRIIYLRSRGSKRTKEENKECDRIGRHIIELRSNVADDMDSEIQRALIV